MAKSYYNVSFSTQRNGEYLSWQKSRILEAESKEEAIETTIELETKNEDDSFKIEVISCEPTSKFMYEVYKYMNRETDSTDAAVAAAIGRAV